MADIQIQDLPPATTPLGSGDVLPIVQSGITKSVTISSGEFVLADRPNTFTSANTFSATGSSYRLRITSGSGNGKYVVYQTGGSTRWEIGSSSAVESGAESGSDLIINRYDDTGTYVDTPVSIDRKTGYVLVGYSVSNGAYRFQVNSQIFATSATIATSDGNYKEDITPLDGALELVSALNPVQFSWKEHPVHNFDRAQPTVGFIAQEVQQALADTPYLNSIVKANTCTIEREEFDEEGNVTKPAVTEEFLGIAEGNMIALLTKAIQELKSEFDAYKASHP